jgi:hypothetical protein
MAGCMMMSAALAAVGHNYATHTHPGTQNSYEHDCGVLQCQACSSAHQVPCLMRAAIQASCAAKGVLLPGPDM